MPWPTPMHMVAMARLAPRSRSSIPADSTSRAPLMPRMPEGDRAAIGVDVLGIVWHAEAAQCGQRLGGERLIELDDIDVGEVEPCTGHELTSGRLGTDPLIRGRYADGGHARNAGQRSRR